MADPLNGGGYPALHEAADQASVDAQCRFFAALRLRLGGLLVAALGAALTSISLVRLGGWIAVLGFLVALGAELFLLAKNPDRSWYEGRAAAESAKTLAWRYAVRGESFDAARSEGDTNREFVHRISEVLDDMPDLQLEDSGTSTEQITPLMRRLRAGSFTERKATYREGRIEDQRAWYAKKATQNSQAENRWTVALFGTEILGVIGGILLLTGHVTLDLLAIFAAIGATITAWMQAKQHNNLATAYGITAQELASVKSELDSLTDEVGWAAFVGQAEEAISREHTLWRASRGIRTKSTRRKFR